MPFMRQPRHCLFSADGLFLNALPCPFYVPGLCMSLPYTESKSELAVEFRMGQKEIAAAVQSIHDPLIDGIASLVAKAHQVQGYWRGQFKALVFADPMCELLRQLHV